MNDNINIHNKELDDIEHMLQPQCEFHASPRIKKEVMESARMSMSTHQAMRFFPWICAACVAGIIAIVLQPPKDATPTTNNVVAAANKTTQPSQKTKMVMQEKETMQEKEPMQEKAIASESGTYEMKKNTSSKHYAKKNKANPKMKNDRENIEDDKAPILIPMSTLPAEHLFKMQTAEPQTVTCNAAQSEHDVQQKRRIIIKL